MIDGCLTVTLLSSQPATCSTSTQWTWSLWRALRPWPRPSPRRWPPPLRPPPPSCTSRCPRKASRWQTTRGSESGENTRAHVCFYGTSVNTGRSTQSEAVITNAGLKDQEHLCGSVSSKENEEKSRLNYVWNTSITWICSWVWHMSQAFVNALTSSLVHNEET